MLNSFYSVSCWAIPFIGALMDKRIPVITQEILSVEQAAAADGAPRRG